MKKGYLYIIFATMLFSTMEIALKFVSGSFHPVQMTLSRFLIGGIVLLPFALSKIKKDQIQFKGYHYRSFAFLGFMCVVISMMFYQMAVMNTQASVVAVLFSGNPVFVILFAYFILKEKILKQHVAALLLEVIGILIIINPLATKLSVSGVIFTLLATVTFAIYSVFGKKRSLELGGVVVTCFSFLFGSIELLILTLFTRVSFVSDTLYANGLEIFSNVPLFQGYTLGNILIILYIFICITGGGYAFYFKAMEETSSSTASLVFFFKPVLAPILALLILKEAIPWNMVVGIAFILVGSMASLLPSLLSQRKIQKV